MKIETTDDDLAAAFTLRHGTLVAWQALKAYARQCAAERMLEVNMARQKEICELLPKRSGEEWMRLQDEFTRLMAEHEELLGVAFPRISETKPTDDA